uniref:Neuroendocrine protein 7B2 n=2 Tax=Daphnia magna TaxID=35525 RepID=A0A0P6H311_9CRUS
MKELSSSTAAGIRVVHYLCRSLLPSSSVPSTIFQLTIFWFPIENKIKPFNNNKTMAVATAISRRSATGTMVCLVLLLSSFITLTTAFRSHQETMLSDAYLRGIMNHLGDKMLAEAAGAEGYLDYPLPSYEDMMMSPSVASEAESDIKEYEEAPEGLNEPRERLGLGLSLRDQEYLKHSSLFSRQQEDDQPSSGVVGAPTGSLKISETASTTSGSSSSGKSENVLPAYCNPPNPCPIGYTAEDGCLEEFENTAAFSREYQAAQDCMCDTEHMFDCPASSLNHKNDNAKNRAAANMVDTAIRKIMSDFQSENPYLQGDKLPIAAKKGNRVDV